MYWQSRLICIVKLIWSVYEHKYFTSSSLLSSLHCANCINYSTYFSYSTLMCGELIQARFIRIYTEIVWIIFVIFKWMMTSHLYSRCDHTPFKKIHFFFRLLVHINFKKYRFNHTKCPRFRYKISIGISTSKLFQLGPIFWKFVSILLFPLGHH